MDFTKTPFELLDQARDQMGLSVVTIQSLVVCRLFSTSVDHYKGPLLFLIGLY